MAQATIHLIAIAVGMLLAWLVKGQLSKACPIQITCLPTAIVAGTMTSREAAIWNSALDTNQEINKQKQALTTQLASGTPAAQNEAAAKAAGH